MLAELFQADTRTDMTKLTVAFHNFANAQKQMLSLAQGAIISSSCSAKCTETVSNAPPIPRLPRGAVIMDRDMLHCT
jgi:flagellar basal body P-ring protein FlgI